MKIDPHYDVAIIGAGPCGTTAAMYAAEDASVLLIEKKKVIGVPAQCAGFLPKYDDTAAVEVGSARDTRGDSLMRRIGITVWVSLVIALFGLPAGAQAQEQDDGLVAADLWRKRI